MLKFENFWKFTPESYLFRFLNTPLGGGGGNTDVCPGRQIPSRRHWTAQCAPYMWVPWKFSRLPDHAHGYFFPNFFHGLLFRFTLWICAHNLKSVALPVPKIIVVPKQVACKCSVKTARCCGSFGVVANTLSPLLGLTTCLNSYRFDNILNSTNQTPLGCKVHILGLQRLIN